MEAVCLEIVGVEGGLRGDSAGTLKLLGIIFIFVRIYSYAV